jgi:SH3-like domain-containing protein
MSPVEVLHLDDYSRVVATLVPGNWYLAKREMSGWAQVVAAEGVEGWVPRQTLHRQG